MTIRANPQTFPCFFVASVVVTAALLVHSPNAFAQPGSGNCQRNGVRSQNGAPPTAMKIPSRLNSGGITGIHTYDNDPIRTSEMALSRQDLQKKYQAALARIREQQAAAQMAIAAQAARRKQKSTKPSNSATPTAGSSQIQPGRPVS